MTRHTASRSLALAYRAQLPPAARSTVSASVALNSLLQGVCEAASLRRPTVRVEDEGFVAHLAQKLGAKVSPASLAEFRYLADLHLAYASGQGDGAAINELEQRVLARVEASVLNLFPDAVARGDALSAVRERLLMRHPKSAPKILDYSGRGPLTHWIRASVVREALRQQRAQKPRSAGSDEVQLSAALVDALTPELALLKGTYREHFKVAFRKALGSLEDRERQVLLLTVRHGLTAEAIGEQYGVHGSNVGRWLKRMNDKLQLRTRQALAKELRLSLKEVDSILRLLRSSLDMSLGGAED